MSKEKALNTLGTKPSFSSQSLNRSAMAGESGAGLSLSAMTSRSSWAARAEAVGPRLVGSLRFSAMLFVSRALSRVLVRVLARVLATVISLTFVRANYTLRRHSDIASKGTSEGLCTL